MHPVRALLPAFVLLSCAASALAQPVPLGPPFLVNTTTEGVQAGPAVAADAAGRFAIVWGSTCAEDPDHIFPPCSPDPRTSGVFGRWFDAAGQPLGPDIRLSPRVSFPDLAVGADGSFFVVWGDEEGIHGRRFDASGTPLSRAVRISQKEGDSAPVVAAVLGGAGGGYWAAWLRRGEHSIVMARRLDSAGRPAGPEIRVSTEDSLVIGRPAIAVERSGSFLVAWTEFPLGTDPVPEHPLLARRFKASGMPLGREVRLDGNEISGVPVGSVSAAPLDGGGFLVTWVENSSGVYARALEPDGSPGEKRRVSLVQGAFSAALTRDSRGGFLAVWTRTPLSGAPFVPAVLGRRLDEAGRPVGPEITVVADPQGDKESPDVAATPGGLVVAWDSGPSFDVPGPDGNASGVFARRFGIPPAGADLCFFGATEAGFRCDLFRDGGVDVSFGLGEPSDTPLFGDFDGDGRDDPCVFRAGRFLCDITHEGEAEVDLAFQPASGLPLLGDVNGDGRDDACLYAGHQFLCDTAHDGGTAELVVPFGRQGGDVPLLGDLDGDQDDDPCVYRGRQLLCDLAHDGGGSDLALTFGSEGDRPLLADFDGDGRDDLCVARGNLLLCDTAHNGGGSELQLLFNPAGGTLVPGNVDGY